MKKLVRTSLSDVVLECNPLSQDSEGLLRGGFVGMQGAPVGENNDHCSNSNCSNSGCTNTYCNNNGCNNAPCENIQTPPPTETPAPTPSKTITITVTIPSLGNIKFFM